MVARSPDVSLPTPPFPAPRPELSPWLARRHGLLLGYAYFAAMRTAPALQNAWKAFAESSPATRAEAEADLVREERAAGGERDLTALREAWQSAERVYQQLMEIYGRENDDR